MLMKYALGTSIGMVLAATNPAQSVPHRFTRTALNAADSVVSGTKPRGLLSFFQLKESQNKHFCLGFAGRIQTLLMGSCDGTELDASLSGRQPMIEVNHVLFPSVYVTADYDFAKSQNGITHIGTTLQCPVKPWLTRFRPGSAPTDRELKHSSHQTTLLWSKFRKNLSQLLPATIEITREREVLEANEATEIVCRWPVQWSNASTRHDEMGDMTIQHRKCKQSVTTTLLIPVHSRLRFKCRFRNRMEENVEPQCDDDEGDWWIPDVCVDALGLMESKNQLWLENQRIGLSLGIRRRLNWSALGLLGGLDDLDSGPTRIQFQVQHRSPAVSSMVEISSFLDQPLRSVSFLLQQDFTYDL